MSENEIDVEAIAEKWLQQCGSCDAGLPMGCACPSDDYRPVMSALLDEVTALRGQVERARALMDSWPLVDNGQEYRRGVIQAAKAIRAALDGPR